MPSTRTVAIRVSLWLLTPALLFSVVGLAPAIAGAQPDRPASPPPLRDAQREPLLRGPAVEDAGIPGTNRAFSNDGAMRGPQERVLDREIPMPEFMRALRALNEPETPDDLHLTPEQRESLGAIAREHAQAMRQHLEAHREEIAGLGQTLGFDPMELQRAEQAFGQRLAENERRVGRTAEPRSATVGEAAPRNGQAPGAQRRAGRPGAPVASAADAANAADASPAQPPSQQRRPEQIIRERLGDNPTPAQRGALERLRQIREGGPSGLEAQTKVWNQLSPPQQQFVQARLDETRARIQAERGEMYVQEMMGRDGPIGQGAPGRPLPPGGEAQREAMVDALAAPGSTGERLHRLIDRLSPEQQERLLRYVETRLNQSGGPGRPDARPGQPGRRPLPPPSMDEVDVPPADPL